jgi:hypothetical protein
MASCLPWFASLVGGELFLTFVGLKTPCLLLLSLMQQCQVAGRTGGEPGKREGEPYQSGTKQSVEGDVPDPEGHQAIILVIIVLLYAMVGLATGHRKSGEGL